MKSKKQSSLKIPVLDSELEDKIIDLPEDDQRDYLFLSPHPKLKGRWYVDALHPGFFIDFEDIIGRYRTVSPASLDKFIARAEYGGYHPVFTEDPFSIMNTWEDLNDPPEFSLNSTMPNTTAGMLSFQLQGFNYLKKTPKGGLAVWSTGTGKTALEAALIKQHLEHEGYDLAIVVCKKNNKVDTQRKLKQLGNIDSTILDGKPDKRLDLYADVIMNMSFKPQVVICNYEKLRDDTDCFIELVTGRDVVIFWDEMPTKLSNRSTQLYQGVRSVLYATEDSTVKWHKRRANRLRQYDLSATPIENDPVGLLNQVRLIDPEIWPSTKKWESSFVAGRNFFSKEPEKFKNLDLMGMEIEHIFHQVDKEDPDIAILFPKVREETIYVDWSPEDRRLYDAFQKYARDLTIKAKEDPSVKRFNPLQLIGVLQMICDAPSMLQKSAANRVEFEEALDDIAEEVEDEEELELLIDQFISGSEAAMRFVEAWGKEITDAHCNKLDRLIEIITLKHQGEKVIVFSRLAGYIQPIIAQRLEEAGVGYVIFRGTEKQRQEAMEKFRNDPDIHVFLSSDIGSDSIDLPEATANVNYDLPLTHARKIQRRNRNHRVNSIHEFVFFYDLLMPDSVEDRIAEIVETKYGYHRGIFKGDDIVDENLSARMTTEDLWYILTGELPDVQEL